MVISAYKKALALLLKKPFRLWGISLLGGLLAGLAGFLGVLPIVVIPVVLVLGYGMTVVYYKGLHGEEVNSDLLFLGFRDFWKTAGTMGWMGLWTLIWSPVPVANLVKVYSYRFVPYLLMTRPELTATEALRVSMSETKGYRWKLLGADLLAPIGLAVAFLVLWLLSLIPFIGVLFTIVAGLLSLACGLLLPLFMGLVQAEMFDEVQEERTLGPRNRVKGKPCPACGAPVAADAKFCPNCGYSFAQYQPPQYQPPYQPQAQYQPPQYQQPVYPVQPTYQPQETQSFQQPAENTPNSLWNGQSGEYQPPQQG